MQNNIGPGIVNVALLVIAKDQKNLNDQRGHIMIQLWHIYTMESFTAIKKKEAASSHLGG